MGRRLLLFVTITTATGCGSTVGQTGSNQLDPNGVLTIGTPSTQPTNTPETNERDADAIKRDTSAALSRPEHAAEPTIGPERCSKYERRDPRPGDLAWISECQIKTAKPIYFQFNSDMIHIESESILQTIANLLRDEPALRIEIGAHSDGKGSKQFNLELTQKRADAVKNHLIGIGIDPYRLVARGFGEERPISHPPLMDGQRTNRRIEFIILSN